MLGFISLVGIVASLAAKCFWGAIEFLTVNFQVTSIELLRMKNDPMTDYYCEVASFRLGEFSEDLEISGGNAAAICSEQEVIEMMVEFPSGSSFETKERYTTNADEKD